MSVRRLAVVAAAALVPLVPTTPAFAADNVICVGSPSGVTCDQTAGSISAALTTANANSVDDTIEVAAGHYFDGPYMLDGTSHRVTLQGAGQGATFLDLPASASAQDDVTVVNGVIRDLTVVMSDTTAVGDVGISTSAGTDVTSVAVSGTGAQGATGMRIVDTTVSDVSVQMGTSLGCSCTGIFSDGGNSVVDTSIGAATGYSHSALAGDTLSRLRIKAAFEGIYTDVGPVSVDDTLVDLGTSNGSHGLAAYNSNAGTDPMSISADHVTIAGGTTGSIGAYAAATVSGVDQHAAIQLTNSIVSGPETSLQVEAGNDGSPGTNSTATITTSYSDWSTQFVQQGDHGTATITNGAGRLNVSPAFVNAAGGDFRLAPTSPVIDKGAPGTGGPTLDLAKGARILDGNGDGTAVRDMGAYEAPKKVVVVVPPDTTAPNTSITSHPRKRTTKRRVTFGFTSNEAHVTFQCRLDKKAWGACTSPKRVRVTKGWHVFKVRAIDRAHNVDPTPARFRFHRV